jgi:hypothetical protein
MKNLWNRLALIALACAGWMAGVGQAQETLPPRSSPSAARLRDRVATLIRREAEAQINARQDEFARLKAIPPGPELRIRFGPRRRIPLWVRVRPDGEGADGDAPGLKDVVVAEEVFDNFMFGSTGDAESGRAHAAKLLDRLVDQFGSSRLLTPAQRQKLRLAGRGDIKRLFDQIEEERRKFEALRSDPDKCEQFLDDLLPLRQSLQRGPFETDSLFSKTLKKLVDDEKRARARAPTS